MRRLLDYSAEAFAAIWRNRLRSMLTMLGMIIGTASIIAVLGISSAASGGITGTLNSFGDQGVSISVDPNQDDPQSAAIQYRDSRTLAADLGPLIDHIEPSYQRSLTNGMPHRWASFSTISLACLLVPTNSTRLPRLTTWER